MTTRSKIYPPSEATMAPSQTEARAREPRGVPAPVSRRMIGAELERLPGHLGQQPGAVVVDGATRGIVPVPAQEAFAPRLGDAALPWPVLEFFQTGAGMVALVGHQFGRVLGRRRRIDSGQVGGRTRQRFRQGGGVALVGLVHLDRHYRAGVEVHRMFGLV